jgi:hypothetical protein
MKGEYSSALQHRHWGQKERCTLSSWSRGVKNRQAFGLFLSPFLAELIQKWTKNIEKRWPKVKEILDRD